MSQTQGGDANVQAPANGQTPAPPRKASGKKAAPRKAASKKAAAPPASIATDPPTAPRKQRTKAQIARSTAKMLATRAAKAAAAAGTQAPIVAKPTPAAKPGVTATGITMPIDKAATWFQNALQLGLKGNVTIIAAA